MYCRANSFAKAAARDGLRSVTVTVRMFESGFALVRMAVADSGFFSFFETRWAAVGKATGWRSVLICRVGSVPARAVPAIVALRLSGWSSSFADASYSFFWADVYAAAANVVRTRQIAMIHHCSRRTRPMSLIWPPKSRPD